MPESMVPSGRPSSNRFVDAERCRGARVLAIALVGATLAACAPAPSTASAPVATPAIELDIETFELANGLDVVLHVDRSDPLAAVNMTFHVGSAKETPGRTGFAHLFEHLFFLDSENLGAGGLDRLMARVGSATNGSTSYDRTNYFEVVPVDALEKALWAEADKLGFFINTMTASVVDKERQVVKNEKRQSVDNRPFGHIGAVVAEALYPQGHPYRWTVIGSLEDLDAASVDDAKAFHHDWYGPNNATLLVAGDIDVAETRAWIEKYFAEIPARPLGSVADVPSVALARPKRLLHEDNFARTPRLTLTWPTVPAYHEDAYALDALAGVLSEGKRATLYRPIVEDLELAPDVAAFASHRELGGEFRINVSANPEVDLDRVYATVMAELEAFADRPIDAGVLAGVLARREAAFYRGLSSALAKTLRLANYHLFAPTTDFLAVDMERTLSIEARDVRRAYGRYLARKPHIVTSFVPRGRTELAVADSRVAGVVEEAIVQGVERSFSVTRGEMRTPSGAFDRGVEPPFGSNVTLSPPGIWSARAGSIDILGIEQNETPLVEFALRFPGGLGLDTGARGTANLVAEILLAGTQNRTPAEFEEALALAGATLDVAVSAEGLTVSGSTFRSRFDDTISLLREALLSPRWDAKEFELAKARVTTAIVRRQAGPVAVAADVFLRRLYGDHPYGAPALGSVASVSAIGSDDLVDYFERAVSTRNATFFVAGAVDETDVVAALEGLVLDRDVTAVESPAWDESRAGLYFVDVPDAKQSVINAGYLAPPVSHPDAYPARVMNYRFGSGGFASDLVQELREGKGYTYGIRARFGDAASAAPYVLSSSVRANVTLEALERVRALMTTHGDRFDAEDLAVTQSFLLRANATRYETLAAKLGYLVNVGAYGLDANYITERANVTREMTVDRVRDLAARYLERDMVWVVVGDAATQAARLASLGLGPVVRLDREGRALEPGPAD